MQPNQPQVDPNAPKKGTDKKEKEINRSLPPNVPTNENVNKLLGVPADPQNQNPDIALQKKCPEIIANLKGALNKSVTDVNDNTQLEKYNKAIDLLEKPLVTFTENVDFSKVDSVNEAVNNELGMMLGITDEKEHTDEKIKEQLTTQMAIKENDVASVKEYIKMRLLLNIRDQVELEKLKEEAAFSNYIEYLKKREAESKEVANKGRSNELKDATIGGKKLTPKQLEKLKAEENAKKLADGVYAVYDEKGELFVVITEFNDKSIKAAVDALSHKAKVTWHNMPEKHRHKVTIECLKKGIRCNFDTDTNEPILSQTMPKPPQGSNNWAEWIKNVEGFKSVPTPQAWEKQKSTLLKTLVQDVVGDDPKRLVEFWRDLNGHKDEPGMPKPEDVYKHLTARQVEVLEKAYEDRVKDLDNKVFKTEGVNPAFQLKERDNKTEALLKKTREEMNLLRDDINKLSNEIEQKGEKLEQFEGDRIFLNTAIKQDQETLVEKTTRLRLLDEEIKKLTSEIEPLENKKKNPGLSTGEEDSLKQKKESLDRKNDEQILINQDTKKLSEKIEQNNKQLELLNKEKEPIAKEKEQKERELDKKKNQRQENELNISRYKKQLEAAKKDLDQLYVAKIKGILAEKPTSGGQKRLDTAKAQYEKFLVKNYNATDAVKMIGETKFSQKDVEASITNQFYAEKIKELDKKQDKADRDTVIKEYVKFLGDDKQPATGFSREINDKIQEEKGQNAHNVPANNRS